MEITIIGWYGTETIGDRAILAGIFRILSESIGDYSIRLGSLFPFYTQRTVIEDDSFYKKASNNEKFTIKIFDSRNPFELRKNIKHTDVLMVGGGPLMDLQEMSMLDYAFYLAARYKKKTVLMGCGWGPLKSKKCINIARRLIDNASIVIFRDDTSKKQAIENGCIKSKIHSLIDPAFIACNVFKENAREASSDHISVNFRDVNLEGDHYYNGSNTSDVYIAIIKNALEQSALPIHFVPMHTFFIGGDDRVFLLDLANRIDSNRIKVIQTPLSVEETMSDFYNAAYCIGMRFHSIVLQTAINGNNFIVDYTSPENGKIIGMMKKLCIEETYKDRYISLYSEGKLPRINLSEIHTFNLPSAYINESICSYSKLVKLLL